MRALRVGVVGLGVISRFHLEALAASPDWDLVAVCDLDPARAAAPPPGAAGYTDHVRMLERERPDAVVVTAPNDAHARICADALTAGAAVCAEKPLALDLAEGEALAALARERGVPLFTAFHRRYNSEFAALRERIAGRAVAEVTVRYLERIEEHAGDDTWYLDPARCGGGCVADNGPNAFDLVEALLGRAEVVGARVERDGAGVDRRADVALAAGAARARVLLDWSHPGECKDVEVRTADGRVWTADLLAGRPAFKESLWHEYEGVAADFAARVRRGRVEDGAGVSALRLVADAYRAAAREERVGR
ncbi:L-arabinose 1-dehydrogenase (NAD(P)(+)) [Nocardiopsis dassonvillei]|uniref:Gfo/Idh/MocA family protein n=1 Tax=Nocardiopsis dassonvillei TaxID=2014 RepID=UPI003F553FD0